MSTSSIARALALAVLALAGAQAQAAVVFATWDSVDLDADAATGSIGALTVTLAGTGATPGDLSFFQAATTIFDSDEFSPRVFAADRLEIAVSPAPAQQFTLNFSAPVFDPIIHLGSVASVITFTGGITTITRMDGASNDANFSVAGLVVSAADNFNDADGTIRLDGPVSTVTFTTLLTGPYTVDGIAIGIGADATAVPAPGALALFVTALGAAALRRRH